MIGACGGIVVNAFLNANTAMDASDGRCHKGISKRVTIPFLTVDIVMGCALTAVFVYLLRPFVGGNWLETISVRSWHSKGSSSDGIVEVADAEAAAVGGAEGVGVRRGESAVQRSIKRLLRKTIVGASAITVVTLALFVVQYTVGEGGEGVALVCSSICLADGKLVPLPFFCVSKREHNHCRKKKAFTYPMFSPTVFWGYLVIHYLTFCSLETEQSISESGTGTVASTSTTTTTTRSGLREIT